MLFIFSNFAISDIGVFSFFMFVNTSSSSYCAYFVTLCASFFAGCIAASIEYMKHLLSLFCTFTHALRSAKSFTNSMYEPPLFGLYLIMPTTRSVIPMNLHPDPLPVHLSMVFRMSSSPCEIASMISLLLSIVKFFILNAIYCISYPS